MLKACKDTGGYQLFDGMDLDPDLLDRAGVLSAPTTQLERVHHAERLAAEACCERCGSECKSQCRVVAFVVTEGMLEQVLQNA